jgi:hypothetical protein
MAVFKQVLCRQRVRRVPPAFSWLDHRLVRDRHLARCSVEALALYLFLVTVCDGEGLSYYSDRAITGLLPLDGSALARARQQLLAAGLIAYQKPLYQVLALDPPRQTAGTSSGTSPDAAQSLREILQGLQGGEARP